ncbi:MAG: accessory gene regulator B family protein [Lachnospiraceae bacterium]|nr:accessory gene regulator B family protein [Lachnospiraceae bacterium]
MIGFISEKLTGYLLKRETICQEEYEIYLFGMAQFFRKILVDATVVFLGILFGKAWEMIIFLIAFRVIRIYAGGYHAVTPFGCYLLTILMLFMVLLSLHFISWNLSILTAVWIFASVLILALAPIEVENRPIEEAERIYYKRKVRVFWILENIAILLCMVLHLRMGAESIVLAQATLGMALLCEKWIHGDVRND